MERTKTALNTRIYIEKLFAWTDSKIVLSWLVNFQIDFKVFVTNRITKIKTLLPECCWNHISSENNPADYVYRGLLPSQLWSYNLYWERPDILRTSIYNTSTLQFNLTSSNDLPEIKTNNTVMFINIADSIIESISRFSSLLKAQRVFAWIWRFVCKTWK